MADYLRITGNIKARTVEAAVSEGLFVTGQVVMGAVGPGVVPGGTTAQALVKASNDDFDTDWETVDKVFVGLSNVPNVDATDRANHIGSQLASSISDFSSSADARVSAQKAQANGLATLDSSSKVPSAQLPALAITDVFVVNSQAAQLTLVAEKGDVAVRTDQNKSYVNNGGTAGTIADWSELLTPTDLVQSVNGRTGTVTGLAEDSGVVHTSGDETVSGLKSFQDGPQVYFPDNAGAHSLRLQNSDGARVFQLKSDGDSYMDFRIHNSPFNEANNGSFEDWDTSSSPWAWATLGGATLTQESGSTNKRLGTYSCKLTTSSANDALIQYTSRSDNEGINVTVALCYKKSSGSANLWLAAYDTTTGSVYTEMELDSIHDGKTIDFGLSWFRPRLTFAPSGSGHQIGIKIYQKTAGNAVYYIDEVQIHEGDGEYAWTDSAIVVGQDQFLTSNKTFRKDYKQKFRDDNQYINSDSAGFLDIAALTAIKLNSALWLYSSTQTASFTVGGFTHYACDATAGDVTVSFPNASGLDGKMYIFTKKTGNNKLILDAFGSQLVGLATTLTLQLAGDYAIIVATEGHWRLISSNVGNASVYQEAKTASFTVGAAGGYACDATSGAITVSFPSASGLNGTRYTFIKTDSSTNAVILDAFGSQSFNLNGLTALTVSLTSRFESVTIEAQSGNWIVVGQSKPQKRVVALTDAATITPSADTTDIGTVTLGGNRTIAAPSGTAIDGQVLQLRIKQDGTGSRTLSWNSIYRFPAATAPTLTTGAAKTDFIEFTYNAADTKWDMIRFVANF